MRWAWPVLFIGALSGPGCGATAEEPGVARDQPRTLTDVEVAVPLEIELVFGRDAITLYARDPTRTPACNGTEFPDVGVCAEWTDLPCDAHLAERSMAPCLTRAELVVRETGERFFYDMHGGVEWFEPFTFDMHSAPLALSLEGCGLSAWIDLPSPTAVPPAVIEVSDADGGPTVVVDRATQWVVFDDGALAGTACGAAPSDEVSLAPLPGRERRVAAIEPLAQMDSAFGLVRVWQLFEPVREVQRLVPDANGRAPLPLAGFFTLTGGEVTAASVEPDGAVEIELSYGPESDALRSRIVLGPHVDLFEKHFPDGRVLRATSPARVRGGGLGRFEAFSLYWRELLTWEDPSGATAPSEEWLWLELAPGIAMLPPE